jgi:hypothetical protein
MSIAAWVRHALGLVRGCEPSPSTSMRKKLDAVREAARHNFPSGDIESILAEMNSSYSAESQS